jgi:hypothetical protein
MALEQDKLSEADANPGRPIELITENGFSIVRTEEDQRRPVRTSGSFAFIVTDPEGAERDVTVAIAEYALREIGLINKGRIARNSSFWICCAERRLADYLWEKKSFPPAGRLEIEQLSIDDFNLARRWRA